MFLWNLSRVFLNSKCDYFKLILCNVTLMKWLIIEIFWWHIWNFCVYMMSSANKYLTSGLLLFFIPLISSYCLISLPCATSTAGQPYLFLILIIFLCDLIHLGLCLLIIYFMKPLFCSNRFPPVLLSLELLS